MDLSIRQAREDDLASMVRIYNHAVENTAATFDVDPFEPEDRREWFERFGGEHPLIVCEAAQGVVGYAYYLPYRPKPAYGATKETTVYVDPAFHGRGVGSALYARLIEIARLRGIHVLLGILGGKNAGSEALHEKFGFERVGHYRQVGRKFGDWVDTVTYQLILE